MLWATFEIDSQLLIFIVCLLVEWLFIGKNMNAFSTIVKKWKTFFFNRIYSLSILQKKVHGINKGFNIFCYSKANEFGIYLIL